MRRRTLDLIVSTGALCLALLLVAVGLLLRSDAQFADRYTTEQLNNEGITFKEADKLTDAEREFTNARTGCLFTYAGQTVSSGEQAACFANEYIGGHLADPERSNRGLTYAQLGALQGELRDSIADAEETNDPSLSSLQEELTTVTAARETVFKGTMLRNSLLTAYGFSVLGERAGQGAAAMFVAAALLMVLSAFGLVHASRTPRTKPFAPVDELPSTPNGRRDRELVHV